MAIPKPEGITASLQQFGLARDQMRAALAHAAGISATDLDALEHLEAGGPLTQRELGDRLCLTSGAITMLVDRLERAGWVHRRPHPRDRRAVLLELSPHALARAPAGLASYHDSIRTLARKIPREHREAIHTFLRAVADAASRATEELRSSGPDHPVVERLRADASDSDASRPVVVGPR